MRWDELFADIESQLEHELDTERLDVAAEEERLRLGRLVLRDRLIAMGHGGEPVMLELSDGMTVALRIDSTGRDWVAGTLDQAAARRSAVVPLRAIAALLPAGGQLERGMRPPTLEPASDLAARLGVAFVVRDLCRRRVAVELTTTTGRHHGTIDRVGRDHLDLAEHDPDEPRRERLVRRIRLVPFDAIVLVRV